MKIPLLLATLLLACTPTSAQDTLITETAYQVLPSYGGKYQVQVTVLASNLFEDRFASHPTVRVTARAADGSVITTRDISSAGIPPKQSIAFCGDLYADELPARVDIRPLDAGYEQTVYRLVEFRPFELLNVRIREDAERVRFTGEIKNPYPGETGAWITLLFRDEKGKLLGGHSSYESTIPAGDPSPFEFYLSADEIPKGMKSMERTVFSHNNEQSSWRKLLRH